MSFDPELHYHNRSQYPETELARHYGKEVAWSLDGTRIVASGADPRELCAAVLRAGLTSDDVVLAHVPYPDEVMLGGSWLAEGGAP